MLILYGNIYKVTRNRLPADVRFRRGASVESRRPGCTQTTPTAGTPLMRSSQRQSATPTTKNRLQTGTPPVNLDTSSESSDGNSVAAPSPRQESGSNAECFEMMNVDEHQAASTNLSHVQSLHERPTTRSLISLRVCKRSNSSPQSRPICSVKRGSFFNTTLQLPSSKNDWRRSSCLASGEVSNNQTVATVTARHSQGPP